MLEFMKRNETVDDDYASARRDDTRTSRFKKIMPMIRKGVGLNDRYRS